MPVPTRREAARLLRSLDPAPWSVRHACAVADVAAWLARAAIRNGHAVDSGAIEAAALLHDADKTPGGRQAGIRHGDGSAAWLDAQGSRGAGRARPRPPGDAGSPTTRTRRRLLAAPLEARIVAYADKRAGQRLQSMDDRFASWRRRYPAGPADPAPGTVRASAAGTTSWANASTSGRSPSSGRSATAAGVEPARRRPPPLGPRARCARPQQ